MNTPTLPEPSRRRLQAHFGFVKIPFRKNMHAAEMYDSRSQREMAQGLHLWTEIRGLSLVIGPSGVGKSITLRRFLGSLDDARYKVIHLAAVPSTTTGFLRSLSRALDLPMRAHASDLFDQAHKHLSSFSEEQGPHPLLVLDDAEGMSEPLLDLLRRMTSWGLDAEDRFSVLFSGTEQVLRTLRLPSLEPLRTRIGFAHALKPFSLEDTRNYVAFHLNRAGGDAKLLSDDACRRIFHASQGRPRLVNQLCLHVLIAAAVQGIEELSGVFVGSQLAAHPLYDGSAAGASP